MQMHYESTVNRNLSAESAFNLQLKLWPTTITLMTLRYIFWIFFFNFLFSEMRFHNFLVSYFHTYFHAMVS